MLHKCAQIKIMRRFHTEVASQLKQKFTELQVGRKKDFEVRLSKLHICSSKRERFIKFAPSRSIFLGTSVKGYFEATGVNNTTDLRSLFLNIAVKTFPHMKESAKAVNQTLTSSQYLP